MRAEFLKLADEIISKNIDDAQRIGYTFSNISEQLDNICSRHNLKSFKLDGLSIREFKML